ncbi:MAG: hypothetical protein FWH26_06845 [Oscillospiraceae bacterium]|nr:hypothetical protein [Oscillospiraceae bacterium]
MDIQEKTMLLRRLAKDLLPESETPESKLIAAILEVLEAAVESLVTLEESLEELTDQVDEIDEDLDEISALLFEDEEGDGVFEVECPGCGTEMQLDEGTFMDGSIVCPGCGETLEFDFGCDCGCGECGEHHENPEDMF